MINQSLRETKIVYDDEVMTRENKFEIIEDELHYLDLYQNLLKNSQSYEAAMDYSGEAIYIEYEILIELGVVAYK